MDTPTKGYTLVKHESDNLYDLTIYDNDRPVEKVNNITLHRACVYIEDATYTKSYQPSY